MLSLTDYEIEGRYKEMLDDVYGEVEICGLTYDASTALFRTDPTAYRCGLSDFEDTLTEGE